MKRYRRLSLVFVWAAALSGGACSTAVSDGDGESHFLAECPSGCPGSLECICGVCTKPCTDDAVCTPLARRAACTNRVDCTTPRVCDVTCQADADCASLSSAVCRDGFCRRLASLDASSSSTGGRTTTATGGGGGVHTGGVGGVGGVGTGGRVGSGGSAAGDAAAGRTGAGGKSTGGAGAGGAPDCTVELSRIPYCDPTYSAALSTVICPPNVDPVSLGLCGDLHLFGFGHDGYTTCAYDVSTGTLVGATSCGIPPLYSASCACHAAGALIGSSCAAPGVRACSVDAGGK
jgi:hypothetical protein